MMLLSNVLRHEPNHAAKILLFSESTNIFGLFRLLFKFISYLMQHKKPRAC